MCRYTGIDSGSGSVTTRRERRKAAISVEPPKQKRTDGPTPQWIIVDFEERGFRCERCGAYEKHSFPQGKSNLESFMLRGRAFAIDHADCKELPHNRQVRDERDGQAD